MLDPEGPFYLMNSMKPIESGAVHNLIICFTPNKSCIVIFFSILVSIMFKSLHYKYGVIKFRIKENNLSKSNENIKLYSL